MHTYLLANFSFSSKNYISVTESKEQQYCIKSKDLASFWRDFESNSDKAMAGSLYSNASEIFDEVSKFTSGKKEVIERLVKKF